MISTSKVGYERRELTYGGLSNSEGGEKRKDRDGLHDGNGERKERGSGGERAREVKREWTVMDFMMATVRERKGGAAVKERLSLVVYKLTNNVPRRTRRPVRPCPRAKSQGMERW
jgi:hypothetical protein